MTLQPLSNRKPVIRWSESTRGVFRICERLYELERLIPGSDKEESWFFSRGHSFGKGVQTYLLTQDMDKALYQAWLSYWPQLEDHKTGKVTQARTLHALQCAKPAMDKLLEDYEVVSFKGMPAVELGFKLNMADDFTYVGFIDLVIRNKQSGLYCVLEIKYTGSWLDPRAMFENTGQGTGYSIVLDRIAGQHTTEYGVLYFVCQDKEKEPKEMQFHTYEFKKTLKDRLDWFIGLGLDYEMHEKMRAINSFPKRGNACIRFNKTCKHFGTCGITAGERHKPWIQDPHEAAGRYQFVYDIQEIVEDHLQRSQ